jgi:hypothetical protein
MLIYTRLVRELDLEIIRSEEKIAEDANGKDIISTSHKCVFVFCNQDQYQIPFHGIVSHREKLFNYDGVIGTAMLYFLNMKVLYYPKEKKVFIQWEN